MSTERNQQTALVAPRATLQEPPISIIELIELFGRSALDEGLDLPGRKLAARICTGFKHIQIDVSRMRTVVKKIQEAEEKYKALNTKLEELLGRFNGFETDVAGILTTMAGGNPGAPGAMPSGSAAAPAGPAGDDGPIAGPPPQEAPPPAAPAKPLAPVDEVDRQLLARQKRGAADDARVEQMARMADQKPAQVAAPVPTQASSVPKTGTGGQGAGGGA